MEPAVTGLDWPFTTNPRSEECFARQHPCEPPSLVRATSPYPGLDRPASGFKAVTPGPIKTPSLTTQRLLRTCRFPYDYKATHFLASPQPQTPWPVFQDGRHDTSQPLHILPCHHGFLQEESHSFHAVPGCHHLVSGTFHTPTRGTFQLSLTVLVRYRT